MAKKFKLEYEPDYDFLLFGIVSYDRDYRISWDINQNLKFDLVRTDDHSVKLKSSEKEMHFSCFIYEDEDSYLNYKLLSNRSDEGYLLDDLKNIDYFLIITGEYYSGLEKNIKDQLVKLESVQNCFVIESAKIKNSHRVL
ncbi:MAG: IPExxxVDY family protein [Bacteroidota bacterium]